MKKLALILSIFALAANVFAQSDKADKSGKQPDKTAAQTAKPAAVPVKANATPLELAQAALAAHGGDKFKNFKSMTQIGSAELTAPGSTQTLAASFKLVVSGEKTRMDINSAFFNFQQIFDGQSLYSSTGGSDVPNLNRLSLFVLNKAETAGYTLSALPDKKKRRSFRITTPEDYKIDFYLDAANGQVTGYEARFMVRDREITTSVEIDKYREVEGILVPEKYSQRLEFGQITSYASFKAKEILLNTTVADDVFTIPQ